MPVVLYYWLSKNTSMRQSYVCVCVCMRTNHKYIWMYYSRNLLPRYLRAFRLMHIDKQSINRSLNTQLLIRMQISTRLLSFVIRCLISYGMIFSYKRRNNNIGICCTVHIIDNVDTPQSSKNWIHWTEALYIIFLRLIMTLSLYLMFSLDWSRPRIGLICEVGRATTFALFFYYKSKSRKWWLVEYNWNVMFCG